MKRPLTYLACPYTHPIVLAAGLPGDWEYWRKFARAYLEHSHRIVVLCLDGWEQSVGVTEELQIANELGIQIEYLEHATKAHSAN